MGVQVVETQKEPQRAKRAPLVPIPADAPKQPDFNRHKEECAAMKTAIGKLYDQIEEKREAQKDNNIEADRQKLRDEKDIIFKNRDAKRKEHKALSDLFRKQREATSEAREKMFQGKKESREVLRNAGEFKTASQIDEEIQKAEFKLESGGVGSIKGEKKIMQQIKDLKKLREDAQGQATNQMALLEKMEKIGAELEKAGAGADDLRAKMNICDLEIKALTADFEAKNAEIQALSNNEARQQQREEIDKLFAKVKDEKKKLEDKNNKFTEDKEKYNEWRVEYNKKCDAERKRRDEERANEREKRAEEDRLRELEMRSIRRQNPHEKEINLAETLIAYLRDKCGGQLPAKKMVEKKVVDFDPAAVNFGGGKFKVMKKGDEEDIGLNFGKKKKNTAVSKRPEPKKAVEKKPEEEPVMKSKPITHVFQKRQSFEELGLKVPENTVDAKKVIEVLKEKKAVWESKKKTVKEAMEEEEAERLKEQIAAKAAEAEEEE